MRALILFLVTVVSLLGIFNLAIYFLGLYLSRRGDGQSRDAERQKEAISKFPAYSSDSDDYLRIKEKVNDFLVGLENDNSEICLTSDDLNALYHESDYAKRLKSLEGFNRLERYDIIDNSIVYRCINYPDRVSRYGYSEYTKVIKFESRKNRIEHIEKTITSEPPSVQSAFQKATGLYSRKQLNSSSIINLIFKSNTSEEGYDSGKISNLVSKIGTVDISGGVLRLSS